MKIIMMNVRKKYKKEKEIMKLNKVVLNYL